MGITLQHAVMIIREAQYRPLPDTVYLIGRQTIYLTADQVFEAFRRCRFMPHTLEVRFDKQTVGAKSSDQLYITDDTFFKMLGAKNVRYIDVSDYEGADIILNLNEPLPDQYAGIADFIFGGSVCDNIFDPATYISNMMRLLSVGGRYLAQEIASNHYHPYVILPHAWFFDYFVLNNFADAKVYAFDIKNAWNIYLLRPHLRFELIPNYTATADHTLGTFIIAERGPETTFHRFPTQDQYRSAEEWADYRQSMARVLEAPRPAIKFRMPKSEQDIDVLPPRQISFFQYLGRFDRYWDM